MACGAAALLALLAVAFAPDARAARLVDVRVGLHPDHARVVLETDAPAAWERISPDGAEEVVVRLGAAGAARSLPARAPGTPSIEIEPQGDGATLVRIRATGPLRVETQVLGAPPRIVLDLRPGAPPLEIAAPPTAVAEAPVAPTPDPVTEEPAPEPPPEAPVVAETEPTAPPAPPAPPAAPELPAAETAPEPPMAPGPEAGSALPPVAAPPPAAIALDARSLATGLALGFAIALFAFAVRRPAPAVAAPPEPDGEPEPAGVATSGPDEAVAEDTASERGAEPLGDEVAHDFVRMHQRLDARLAALAARVEEIAARHEHLDATGAAHGLEISSHRAAIARLRAALCPAPVPQRAPEREETAPAKDSA